MRRWITSCSATKTSIPPFCLSAPSQVQFETCQFLGLALSALSVTGEGISPTSLTLQGGLFSNDHGISQRGGPSPFFLCLSLFSCSSHRSRIESAVISAEVDEVMVSQVTFEGNTLSVPIPTTATVRPVSFFLSSSSGFFLCLFLSLCSLTAGCCSRAMCDQHFQGGGAIWACARSLVVQGCTFNKSVAFF